MLIHNSIPFASLEARHQNLIRQAVDKYVTWLNSQEGQVEPYTIEHFLDPSINQYAHPRVKLLVESKEDMDILLRLSLDTGDYGGPTELFIHAERDFEWEPTGRKVQGVILERHKITGYNTEPDGRNTVVRLDPPNETPYTTDETKMVFKDTYKIGLIVQSFDTLYDTIFANQP